MAITIYRGAGKSITVTIIDRTTYLPYDLTGCSGIYASVIDKKGDKLSRVDSLGNTKCGYSYSLVPGDELPGTDPITIISLANGQFRIKIQSGHTVDAEVGYLNLHVKVEFPNAEYENNKFHEVAHTIREFAEIQDSSTRDIVALTT
jgi:hypothetical protein